MSNTKRGRPRKSFETSSTKSKQRKVHDISVEVPYQELMFAAATRATSSGHRDAAKIIKNISEFPETATSLKQSMKSSDAGVEQYSPTEALAFICKNGFSKSQYNDIRASDLKKGCDLYPSYNRVLEEKKLTYPEGITIKPSAAEVPLQSLVDHTNKRLIESHRSILAGSACNTFEINYKWGCDGSSNHSRYKQNFVETDEDGELREYNDSHIFSMALVPLQLIGRISEHERDIFWKNDLPSSVSLCRPIKLIFFEGICSAKAK
nr:uncharacterized protein LOC115254999 [Aedes albopictus]